MPTKRAIPVFAEVLESLNGNQRKVAAALSEYEDLTGQELDRITGYPSAHKRLSELRKMEVVYVVGQRRCSATGNPSEAWALTGKLPITPEDHQKLKPTIAEMGRCLPVLRKLYLDLKIRDRIEAEDILKLGKWISVQVPVNPAPRQEPRPVRPIVAPPKKERSFVFARPLYAKPKVLQEGHQPSVLCSHERQTGFTQEGAKDLLWECLDCGALLAYGLDRDE